MVDTITYLIAATIGVMFASGTYLVLQRDVVRVIWGVILMSQAANVYLVTMGGIGDSIAPIIGHEENVDPSIYTDPLVQALVLTAIVIGFGVSAFLLVLTYRVYEENNSIDLGEFGRREDSNEDQVQEGG
ncbi:MAG: sodium:proton antiporter [Halobacteria archaeon]|nr:sodium:proton antiporter [Halobacteria archaeon]